MQEFDEFVETVREIRKNCPWDSIQTHESLKQYLMEESGEVLEGIDRMNAGGRTAIISVKSLVMYFFR